MVTPLDQPVHMPPGTPAPLRAAINAAQRAFSQQLALFGRFAEQARHTLPPLPRIANEQLESSVIAPALARLRQQENAIEALDARITALTTAQARAISNRGTRQIAAIVAELNHEFDAITAACGSHPHAHPPAGHGGRPATLPWQIQARMLADLDNALCSAWRVVQQAMDSANHVSGQVAHHSHRIRHHSTTAPVAPAPQAAPADGYHRTVPTAPSTSPLPLDLPTGDASPLPANLPAT